MIYDDGLDWKMMISVDYYDICLLRWLFVTMILR